MELVNYLLQGHGEPRGAVTSAWWLQLSLPCSHLAPTLNRDYQMVVATYDASRYSPLGTTSTTLS